VKYPVINCNIDGDLFTSLPNNKTTKYGEVVVERRRYIILPYLHNHSQLLLLSILIMTTASVFP